MIHRLRRKRFAWRTLSGFGLCTVLSACASTPLPGSSLTETPIGQIEVSQLPGKRPTVVFASGISGDNAIWGDVFKDIAQTNEVFAYHRPGYGNTPDTDSPRDGTTIIEEMRILLKAREIAPPYVVVAHSASGLYTQLYARRYPDEISALVLLDPVHPTQYVGQGSIANRSPFFSALVGLAGFFGPIENEVKALPRTGEEVLAAPTIRADMPFIILTAPEKSKSKNAVFDNAKRADFARLYPTADVRAVESGHSIQADRPEVVIKAVREVLAALKE